MRQAEKERKQFQTPILFILDPGEKIPKKNSKTIQKIKNQLAGVTFSQNGMRQAEKEITEFYTRILLILDPGEKIPKKIAKKFKKIKKQLLVVIFSKNGTRYDEIGRERDKIIFDPNSAYTRPGGENCKNKTAKKYKKLKNNFPTLVFA